MWIIFICCSLKMRLAWKMRSLFLVVMAAQCEIPSKAKGPSLQGVVAGKDPAARGGNTQ